MHCLLCVVSTKNNYELIIRLKVNQKKSPFSNISGYTWPGPKLALKGVNRSIFKGEIFLENHWYTSFTKAFSIISTKI